MNYLDELLKNKDIFFRFLSERFPVFTGANVFLRDIQYGIKFYFAKKNIKLKYPDAEKLAIDLTSKMTENKDLVKRSDNTWKVNFVFKEEFVQDETSEQGND